jgi:hypothetical protein
MSHPDVLRAVHLTDRHDLEAFMDRNECRDHGGRFQSARRSFVLALCVVAECVGRVTNLGWNRH